MPELSASKEQMVGGTGQSGAADAPGLPAPINGGHPPPRGRGGEGKPPERTPQEQHRDEGLTQRGQALPTADATIVGESVLPDVGERGALSADMPHAGVVDVEGPAPRTGAGALLETATAWLFQADQAPTAVPAAAVAELVAVPTNVVWLDLCAYSEPDLREVARLLGLHRKALHAAISPWQRPRLAVYTEHFFTSATVPRLDGTALRVHAAELDLFVGQNFLVSAHKQPLPFAAHLLTRAHNSPTLVELDAAFMLYLILDEVLAYYEELNEHVQLEIERLEERALHDVSDRFLEDLLRFKRYTFALGHLAEQHRAVFAAFLRPDFRWISGAEVEDYFEDLEARLARLLDMLITAREAVNGAFDLYVSHMAHRTNGVIKLLTIVSTVLFSASIIVSIFGTSIATTVHLAPLATPAGLAVMLLCIALVSGATLAAFRHRGWL